VVDVPVDDQHPFAGTGQTGGGHGHIVDQAEAHRLIGQGMMAGRSGGHEGHTLTAFAERVDGHQTRSGGHAGRVPRLWSCVGVCVEVTGAGGTELAKVVEVADRVDTGELGVVCGAGRKDRQVTAEVEIVDTGHHRPDPGRPLGVVASLVPFGTGRPDHDQHCRTVCPKSGGGFSSMPTPTRGDA
jgi:hypothetical protein